LAGFRVVGRVLPRETVVFDVDGVLVDPSERLRRAEAASGGDRSLFWRLFLDPVAALAYDKPNYAGVVAARRAATRYQLVVVTGRPHHMMEATLVQLGRAGVPYDAVVFRVDRTVAPEYKARVVRWLESLGARVVEVHDDSERVLDAVARVSRARLVLWTTTGPRTYRVNGEGETVSV